MSGYIMKKEEFDRIYNEQCAHVAFTSSPLVESKLETWRKIYGVEQLKKALDKSCLMVDDAGFEDAVTLGLVFNRGRAHYDCELFMVGFEGLEYAYIAEHEDQIVRAISQELPLREQSDQRLAYIRELRENVNSWPNKELVEYVKDLYGSLLEDMPDAELASEYKKRFPHK